MLEKPLGINKTDVEWAVCLACGEGRCKGIKGHFPAEWVNEHKEKCTQKALWEKFKDLYLCAEEDEEPVHTVNASEHKCPVEKQIVIINKENCKHCNTLEENMTEMMLEHRKDRQLLEEYNQWKLKFEIFFHSCRTELEGYEKSFQNPSKDVKACVKTLDGMLRDMGHLLDTVPFEEE
jgi:hypothetical protein